MTIVPHRGTPLANGYAEPKERAPKVALLDDFDGDPAGFPHGQVVEAVLLQHSDLTDPDIQRIQNAEAQVDLQEVLRSGKVGFLKAYRQMVAQNVQGMYQQTAASIRLILEELPEVQVISQSQSETPARNLEMVYRGLHNSESFRTQVAASLSLPTDAPIAKIAEELLFEAEGVATQNPACQEARSSYTKQAKKAYERGVVYVLAAGNHGEFARELEAAGVQASPSAFRNLLVNDYVTVVGAATREGQPSTLNSPNSGIEVLELGEEFPWSVAEGFDQSGMSSGTSFAAPLVAHRALQILEREPSLTPFQVEARLMGLESYRVGSGDRVVSLGNGQFLEADGKIEPYILEKLGEGFVTDIFGDESQQLARAQKESTLFGLPGKFDHEFQLIKVRPDAHGIRQLTLETYFDEGHHLLQATLKGDSWDPASVVEELHLDHQRRQRIEAEALAT